MIVQPLVQRNKLHFFGLINPFSCPAGKACPTLGYEDAAEYFDCPEGTFSNEGDLGKKIHCCDLFWIACTLCPAGYTCPNADGSSKEECAAGSFSLRGVKDCTVCPAGHQCPYKDDEFIEVCPAGTFSTTGNLRNIFFNFF
jgi:hypothetical protein